MDYEVLRDRLAEILGEWGDLGLEFQELTRLAEELTEEAFDFFFEDEEESEEVPPDLDIEWD